MTGQGKMKAMTVEKLKNRLRAACGDMASDLVLKGGKVISVFSREIIEADVAIHDGVIAGIGDYTGNEEIDVKGQYICPGFIDGHFHIESSMLSPSELAKAVLPCGTTTIIADPHEIANVIGKRGIQFMLDMSDALPVDFYFLLPSCVPATHLETSGAALSCEDLLTFKHHPRVLGLAEMMNYPGVIAGLDPVLEKIVAFYDDIKDGHAPLLSGCHLNAYIGAGLRSDHECTFLDEALEKLRLGMHIMIRQGTQAKNLKTLLPLVSEATVGRCSLVTDDLHPHDLLRRGHLNHLINAAVAEGIDPLHAILMVTLNTATYFGLKGLGAIAPGYQADILILSSLTPVEVKTVLKNGRVVYHGGTFSDPFPAPSLMGDISPMNIKPFDANSFRIAQKGEFIRVIGLIPDQILTEHRILEAPLCQGFVVSDVREDILKIAVLERHHGTGNIGLGMVQGFGLQHGALASTVAHDSHNIICVGCSDEDMTCAVKVVESMKGGLAAVKDGVVLACLPLPIGGLMSDQTLEKVAYGWEKMIRASEELGCTRKEPFMELSFLALPVIPALKITDKGLVDVSRFEQVSLFMV
jgi:adenine deaminase